MNLTASNPQDYGQAFVDAVAQHGSAAITAPLLAFIQRSDNAAPLRSVVKLGRPALKADIAHFMHICFGRHPGVIDHAASKITDQAARGWLVKAIDGFAQERIYLNQLTVAAGPIHRHLGQDKVNAVVEAQGRSIEMLATSDRKGCAAGAAMAFSLDWQATRPLLDQVALALGIEVPICSLPGASETATLAADLASAAPVQRAMAFGCDQMLAQQRGLWQVIVARHHAVLAE
jgi:hypothetical protein